MKYLKKQDFLADAEHRGLVLVSGARPTANHVEACGRALGGCQPPAAGHPLSVFHSLAVPGAVNLFSTK